MSNWYNRISAVASRCRRSICRDCGGEDLHFMSCGKRSSYGSSAIAFENAVIRAQKSQTFRNETLMWTLKRALMPATYGAES